MASKIKTKIVHGVVWSVLMRWSIKLIGLFSTIVLARILTPEDFGLVAMAMLVIGLIEELSTVNISLLLIRVKNADDKHSNTAWTVNILQSIFLAIILVLLAPYAANYFDEDRVIDIINVLAVLKVITGFQNIGVIIARKELNFSFDFKFMVYVRLAIFVAVIGLALIRQDYWAIVYGTLIGQFVGVILSYYMHPYRPKLCLTHAGEYIWFALPMIPLSLGRLMSNKFDVFIVGGIAGTSTMGIYNMASELSYIFTKEVILPATRGLFPNLTLLVEDMSAFRKTYQLIVASGFTFCLPIGIGLAAISNDLVFVLLGEKWLESSNLLAWLAISGSISSLLILMSEHTLIAVGKESAASKLMWLRLLIIIAGVLVGNEIAGINGIVVGMAMSSIVNLIIIGIISSRLLEVDAKAIIYSSFRPLIASLIMVLGVYYISGIDYGKTFIYFRLLFEVLAGAAIYLSGLYIMWKLFGSEDSVETSFMKRIKAR